MKYQIEWFKGCLLQKYLTSLRIFEELINPTAAVGKIEKCSGSNKSKQV